MASVGIQLYHSHGSIGITKCVAFGLWPLHYNKKATTGTLRPQKFHLFTFSPENERLEPENQPEIKKKVIWTKPSWLWVPWMLCVCLFLLAGLDLPYYHRNLKGQLPPPSAGNMIIYDPYEGILLTLNGGGTLRFPCYDSRSWSFLKAGRSSHPCTSGNECGHRCACWWANDELLRFFWKIQRLGRWVVLK